MTHLVFLGLGSNLGDRTGNLEKACRSLLPKIFVLEKSPIYETAPWGYLEQPAYLNQVVRAETSLSPENLLTQLKQLEVDLGRTTTFHYGPRVIDIDILLYDDIQVRSPTLTIPHPRMAERAFVLVPLADLAPGLPIPALGRTVQELLSVVDTRDILQKFDDPYSRARNRCPDQMLISRLAYDL